MLIEKCRSIFGFFLMVVSFSAAAQLRDNMPPVIEKPVPPFIQKPDNAALFSQAFKQAGRPRIVLMWNRELNDKIKSVLIEKRITQDEGSSQSDVTDRSTSGPSGSSSLRDSDESHQNTKTITASKTYENSPVRKTSLAERNITVIQRSFVREMNRGGVQFVDRALIMRLTSRAGRRVDADPASIEMESLISHADLMLEILMIEDKDASAGYGFDIRVKELKRGIETASSYSRAMPDEGPPRPGAWVAGKQDYEFLTPALPGQPGPDQVGVGLARDVMLVLGRSLNATMQESVKSQRK
jgi:hypothetical protein